VKDEDEEGTESTAAASEKNVKSDSKLDEDVTTSTASKVKDEDDEVSESTAADSEKNVVADSKLDEDVTTSTAYKVKDEDDEVTESTAADSMKNVVTDSKLDEDVTTSTASKVKDEDDEATESTDDGEKNVVADSKLDEDVTTSTASKVKDDDDEVSESTAADSEKNVVADSKLDEDVTTSTASKVNEEDNEVTESTSDDSEKDIMTDSKPDEDVTTSTASKEKDEDDEVTESTAADSEKNAKADSNLVEDVTTSTASKVKDEDEKVTEPTYKDVAKAVTAASKPDNDTVKTTASTVKDEDEEIAESTDKDVAKTVTAASKPVKDTVKTTASTVKDEDEESAESTDKDVAKTVTAASTLDKDAAATTASKIRDEDDEVTESTDADNANTFLAESAKDGTAPTASKMIREEDDDELLQTTDGNYKTIESNRDDTTFTASNTKDQYDGVIPIMDVDATAEADSPLEKNVTLSTASKAKDEDSEVMGNFDGNGNAKEATMSVAEDKLETESNDDASSKTPLSDGDKFEKAAGADDNDEEASRTNGEATHSVESKLIDEDTEITEETDDDDEAASLEKESNAEQVSILGDEVTRPKDGEIVGSGSSHQGLVNAIDEITPFTAFNASVADSSNSTTVFSFENLECEDQHDYVYNGKADARRWMRILSSEPVDEDDDMESYKPAERSDKISSGGQSNFSTTSSAIEDSTEPVMDCSYIAKHREICSEVVHLHLREASLSTDNGSLSSVVDDAIVNDANSADDATLGVDNSTNLATIAEPASKPESLSSALRTYDEDDDDAGENNQVRRTKSAAEESDMDVATVNVSSEGKGESQELNSVNYTSSEDDNVVASASAKSSDESGSENKIVITIGSLYCPVSCNAVTQCEVARDHLTSLNHGELDAVTKDGSAAANATDTSTEGGGSAPSTDLSPQEGSFPKAIDGAIVDSEEVSVGDGEPVSKDEEIPSCSDDPKFLYKGYTGYNCEYIKENKPEKCLKEHNGQLIGVVSCPVSCEMIDKCKALYSVENQFVGKVTSAPAKATEEDLATEDLDHEKELSAASSLSDIESSITTPNEEETIRSNEFGGVCRDDPTFLYKDFEGYDCHYIKENKPEICLKEHSGQLIGVVSCPVSCGMVEQCEDAHEKSVKNANVIQDDVDGKEGSQNVSAETIDYFNAEDIKGTVDHASTEDLDVMNIQDVISEVLKTAGTVSSGGEESSATGLVPITTDQVSTTSNHVVEDGADDGKSYASVSCKDDPKFLYKDKEGYTCQFVGSYKADKCEKEHNGLMIGIYSCPESCDMVDQCLQASEITTAGAVPTHDPCKDLSTYRFNGEPDKDCVWLSQHEKCEMEHDKTGRMIGKYFCPEACGLLEASCFVDESGYTSLSNDDGSDPEITMKGIKTTSEYNSIEEGISGRNDDGYGVHSSSKNEEAKAYGKNDQALNLSAEQGEKLDEKWEVLEQKRKEEFDDDAIVHQDIVNEINNEPLSSSAVWAETRIGDDFKETSNTGFDSNNEMDAMNGLYGNSFNSETKYEDDVGYAYGGSGFGDDNYGAVNGYGYEDKSSWNKIGNAGSFPAENSDGNKNGYEYHEPSNVSLI
jgi:hypothetical protein